MISKLDLVINIEKNEFARPMNISQQVLNPIKKGLRKFVENTPVLVDYYYYYWLYPRQFNLYRYVFSSFSEALADLPPKALSGYNYREFFDYSLEKPSIAEQLKPTDYPVLVWLREAFKDSSTVFDLGGDACNRGFGYYSYRKYISYPESLKWTVCEVPAGVEVGKELSKMLNSSGLYYTTTYLNTKAEIFLCSGMLQYFEDPLSRILTQMQSIPKHIIINHIPLYEGKDYVSLQQRPPSLIAKKEKAKFVSYIPVKIRNHDQFVGDLEALGYVLVDSWIQDRECLIPFHPECFVDSFFGFYFRLRENGEYF